MKFQKISCQFSRYLNGKIVDVIGVSSKAGQPRDGPQLAPQVLREAGLHNIIKTTGWHVNDLGDIKDFQPSLSQINQMGDFLKVNNSFVMGQISQQLSNLTYDACKNGRFPLVLGGDHSIATGSISGVLRKYQDLKIVWVDAHADINTPLVSTSGNYHGMPVAHLLGLFPGKVHGFEWFDQIGPFLKKENITYIGLRDVDLEERTILKDQGIKVYDMFDVQELGISQIMKGIIQSYSDSPIHISFDIDGIDPSEVCGTGTRVRGGLSWRESHHIVKTVYDTKQLVSMDIVELNPLMDQQKEDYSGDAVQSKIGKSANVCLELIKSALGNKFI